jgi:antitoxin component of RelBE/YafQ-DinJ toxin-antitoxin module
LTGNFDDQGISYGVLQWNIGQGSLQPLLSQMITQQGGVMASLFHDQLQPLRNMLASSHEQQMAWAVSIQEPVRHRILEPWKGLFVALGRTPEFQQIQTEHASSLYQRALQMCAEYGLTSERAAALMFEICVQNGSISQDVKAQIQQNISELSEADEVARMRIIANRRAEAARAAFVEDVRARKLTIAEGTGTVHNISYDLEQQFGIRLAPVSSLTATAS